MRNSVLSILRHALSTALGGLVVAAIVLAPRAFAQNEITAESIQSPTVIDEVDVTQKQISYQAILLDRQGRPVANGQYNVTFNLWDAASGGNVVDGPDVVSVTTTNGMFTVLFTLDAEIVRGQDLWLSTQVGVDPEGVPRQKITYVPYAMWSRNSDKFSERGTKYLPISWGIVNYDGTLQNGEGIVSTRCCDSGAYVVRLKDFDGNEISYNNNDYVTVVTPVNLVQDPQCARPTIPGTNSFSGQLIVEMLDRDGGNRQCKFHFVTFKP